MNTKQRIHDLLEMLRQQGNRLTPQRVAIIEAIVTHNSHPSAEQIHEMIVPSFPTTSLATVYKTIHLLKDAGEILELGFSDTGSRFDGRKPYPHPHLICSQCGAIADVDLDDFPRLVTSIAEKSDFLVHNHRFDIFGLCADCKP
ncbi:MAG: transcriptional repressor [Desulfovibrio sp.]|nr:MAG: transcriptional repressor [Desulfovibrio sp.]